jgi:hypothetical protein
MFGQRASWQTVLSARSFMSRATGSRWTSPGTRTFSHSGLWPARRLIGLGSLLI